MATDSSLLMWLDEAKERKIYVVDDFSLDVVGHGDVSRRHGKIFDIYHVPNISANSLYVSQLTQIGNIVDFFPDRFYVGDLKKSKSIVTDELLDSKDNLYTFCDTNIEKEITNNLDIGYTSISSIQYQFLPSNPHRGKIKLKI
jgi:hypothetical protein